MIKKMMRSACLIAVVVMGLIVGVQAEKSNWASRESGAESVFKPIQSTKDVESLKPGDAVAMVCAKCKTVKVVAVSSPDSRGHIQFVRPGTVHECPGCGGKIQIRPGTKETEVVHECSKCGSESAFCCTSKGKVTPGM